MALTSIQGRKYPQKVTLDSNIQTVSGELFSAGTEIIVYLCERLILCRDFRDYCNVDDETEQAAITERVFLNPSSNQDFLDTHCKDELYETVYDLCQERPRYFSCEKEFFTLCSDDRTVRIAKGYEFELKSVKKVNALSPGRDCRGYTNVSPSKTFNIECHCKDVGCDLQISSNFHRYKFKALEDQTKYKPREIIDRFPLPRHVDFMDENIQRLGAPYISSTEICLEKENALCSLLFTTVHQHSESESESGLELKEQIKCCELINPSLVKIKHRIDYSQLELGEQFDTIFVLENRSKKRPVFSLLGRKGQTVVSRLNTGRQPYMVMRPNKVQHFKQPEKSVDSGFVESVPSTGNIDTLPSIKIHPVDDKQKEESWEEDVPPIPKRNRVIGDEDSGDYIGIEKNRTVKPPLLSRQNQEEGYQFQADEDSTIYENKQTGEAQITEESTEEATLPSVKHATTVSLDSSAQVNFQSDMKIEMEPKKSPYSKERLDGINCHDLSCILRKCKLNNFAEKCIEEGVDGDLFLDLTDDILKDEPFCLSPLEILKIKKLKTGWRPKE